ncbi:hypothetical protein LCGC14_2840530 [marine sediment metagenome]|uniref:Uncharacterized protein n=1 Tax=marine sediment metagenome TaxID=412755 RepID=A0A0F8YBH3_9ZZZZ
MTIKYRVFLVTRRDYTPPVHEDDKLDWVDYDWVSLEQGWLHCRNHEQENVEVFWPQHKVDRVVMIGGPPRDFGP